jgi:hypothetical protein
MANNSPSRGKRQLPGAIQTATDWSRLSPDFEVFTLPKSMRAANQLLRSDIEKKSEHALLNVTEAGRVKAV